MQEVANTTEPSGLWRGWRYYALWWVVWTALFTVLQPDVTGDPSWFWGRKAIMLVAGILYGLVLSTIFTLAQNTMNARRRKPVSWALAIGTAVVGKVVTLAFM